MASAALYSAFLPVLRRAGRWLIRRLVGWGLPRLINFIQCRVDTIRRKLGKAIRVRRKRWLGWRIRWRLRLVLWLKRHRAKLSKRAIRALDKQYDRGLERIPWDVAGERYDAWSRGHS